LIVSDKVIKAWQEAGLCSFHTYDVKIAEIKSAKLRSLTMPQYHRVEIDGSCQIDLEASGAQVVKFCPACNHLVTRPSVLNGFRMVSGSWDGSSLFRDQVQYPMVSFCTETILRIAHQHRLTNFRFEPMAGPLDPGNKGIDYLARQYSSRTALSIPKLRQLYINKTGPKRLFSCRYRLDCQGLKANCLPYLGAKGNRFSTTPIHK
jgi:hypothetical protein